MHLSLELTILHRGTCYIHYFWHVCADPSLVVYALYNRNKVVIAILSCLVLLESVLIPLLVLHFLLGDPDLIHGTCMVQQLPLRIIGVPWVY